MKNHIDLFSGIGGFTISCHRNGIQTVVMCEKDQFRQDGLKKAWPGIPIVEDIHDFDGTKWTGAFILTAGVPCAPASRAGKQRGKDDDRWLWPETLRVVAEAKPRWCLFENPPGIYDEGLDRILVELEGIGYETGLVEIPACAVTSPQRRARVWIVANSFSGRPDGQAISICGEGQEEVSMPSRASQSHMADAEENGHERSRPARGRRDGFENNGEGDLADAGTERSGSRGTEPAGQQRENAASEPRGFWDSYLWTPCADNKFRRTPDFTEQLAHGVSAELPCKLVKRLPRKILAALGDSIVPQVACQIIKAIIESDK